MWTTCSPYLAPTSLCALEITKQGRQFNLQLIAQV
jgi:hypothetical protein